MTAVLQRESHNFPTREKVSGEDGGVPLTSMYSSEAKPDSKEMEPATPTESNVAPQSTVYLESAKGKRYEMTFRAKDPEFYFMHIQRRKSIDSSIHKGSQACSTDYFVEVRDLRCQKFVMRMKRYRIASCDGLENTENNEAFLPQDSSLLKQGKKSQKNGENSSLIYVEKEGVLFLMKAHFVHVDIAQAIPGDPQSTGDIQTPTSGEVKKGTYNAEPNRASLIVRVNKDLMRVRFILDEVDIKPISVFVSRGAQCSERYAYVKFLPQSGSKYAYCAVPLSTYMYRDPMKAIRRRNDARRKVGLEPTWLIDERKKRIKQTSRADSPTIQEGQESTRSVIVFEMNGHRVKLRCGHIVATLLNGADLYDDFVLSTKTEQRLLMRSVS